MHFEIISHATTTKTPILLHCIIFSILPVHIDWCSLSLLPSARLFPLYVLETQELKLRPVHYGVGSSNFRFTSNKCHVSATNVHWNDILHDKFDGFHHSMEYYTIAFNVLVVDVMISKCPDKKKSAGTFGSGVSPRTKFLTTWWKRNLPTLRYWKLWEYAKHGHGSLVEDQSPPMIGTAARHSPSGLRLQLIVRPALAQHWALLLLRRWYNDQIQRAFLSDFLASLSWKRPWMAYQPPLAA